MTPLPETIDGVLASLNAILDDAVRSGARIGYFVALYERVTSNVRRAILAGSVFDDNARMEHLDVVFANRFLDAWAARGQGRPRSQCWDVAFAVLDDPNPLVIQHLLLGMNAHIKLDLGIAAATIAPSHAALDALWPDFKRINDVLGRLSRVVEDELCEICPRLQRIADLVTIEEKIFNFGIEQARDSAWAFATDLVNTPAAGWGDRIASRDAEVAGLGRLMYPLVGVPGQVERWVHANESRDVQYNIQVVAE